MNFRADLHIHSCLSPCATLDMSPRAIVLRAKAVGLNAVALADHNSALNAPALEAVCRAEGMHCFYGLEIVTAEEAHALCLFERVEAALDFGQLVDRHLPDLPNLPDRIGYQVVVNERDEVQQQVAKYLVQATDRSWSEWNARTIAAGGLFIPAHIDRPVFSILSQLNTLPDGNYAALEVTHLNLDTMPSSLGDRYPIITNSDAHRLEAVGTAWHEWEGPEWSLAAFLDALTRRTVSPRVRDNPSFGD